MIIRNYNIAGKRGHWPASEDISLPYLTLLTHCLHFYNVIQLASLCRTELASLCRANQEVKLRK